jgi:flagellar basal body P-ring protein FlgI
VRLSVLWYGAAAAFFVAAMLGSAVAQRQTVRDLVEIDGAGPQMISGQGLVVGLNGQGDSPKGETLAMIKNVLGNQFGRAIGDLNSRNVALVMVSAELPPFQMPGTKIDVHVAAMNDAKSLAGGTLYITPLRSPAATPEGGILFGVAQGRVVADSGDGRAGNPTSGVVKSGAIIEQGIQQKFVKTQLWALELPERDAAGAVVWKRQVRPAPTVVLNLKKPDLDTAVALAGAINSAGVAADPTAPASAGRHPSRLPADYLQRNPLATVLDGGRVKLRIPGSVEFQAAGMAASDPGFDREPAGFLSEILMNVTPTETPAKARVVINDANKSFAIVGTVRVKEGHVGWSGGELRIQQSMALSDFMAQLGNNQAVTSALRIDIIRILDANQMIEGEVVSK